MNIKQLINLIIYSMNFSPEQLYHVYNRGNNSQKIFFNNENYLFFLKKIKINITKHCRILSYCLMPNHFHLLLYTNGNLEPGKLNLSFAVLLRSYTRAINLQENRNGSLFQQKTKAKCLNEIKNASAHNVGGSLSDYGMACFNYIHQNPLRAGLVNKMEDWEYSSFADYLGERNEALCDKISASEILNIPPHDLFYKLSYQVIEENKLDKIF